MSLDPERTPTIYSIFARLEIAEHLHGVGG